ncbi:MAG: Bax inhibitor-1/YccA family protein [Caldilineaceae bacterium]|nr:Bax inhibitor-1/YccA family protein [Caldilineaceae bacterium]
MTVAKANPALGQPEVGQNGSDNPALNERAFQRGLENVNVNDRGMTAVGAYLKALILLAVLVVAAGFGWSQVEIISVAGREIAIPPAWTWLAFLLTFILGVAGVFAYRVIPLVAIGYALCQGALLGISSRYFNLAFDGIVLQAVLTTVSVFGATLLLYLFGVIKVSSRLVTGIVVAIGGLLMLYFVAWIFFLFGVRFRFLTEPTPLGIAFGLGVVLLAALSLPLDFEFIRRAAARGAPKFMEWYGAYGLMLSIIWMYVSILRLLALLRMRRR